MKCLDYKGNNGSTSVNTDKTKAVKETISRVNGILSEAQGKSDTTIYQEAYAFNSSFKDIAGKPCPLDKKEADNVIKSVINKLHRCGIKVN